VLGVEGTGRTLALLEGRLPRTGEECAVGAGTGWIRAAGPGRDLILVNSRGTGVLFEVVGMFRSESALLTNDLVVLTNEGVRAFLGFPSALATDIAVEVPNRNEVQMIAAKIKRLYPDTRPITKSELMRTYDMVFNWRGGMMLTVFCAAVIAFSILAWDKATGISADEKQEIGILKAIGWDTGDVLAFKFWEGLAIAVTSFFIGISAGFVHVFFFDATILSSVIKGWSVLFPHFHLVPRINAYQVFVMGFLTVTPYVASTVIPAWKSAITDPDTVMRG